MRDRPDARMSLRDRRKKGDTMRLRNLVLTVGMCMLLLAAVVAVQSCGGSTVSSTTGPQPSATSSELQGGRDYLKALQAVLRQDVALSDRQGKALAALGTAPADPTSSAGKAYWQGFAKVMGQMIPTENGLVAAYAAIRPPASFASAHSMLLAINKDGLRHAQAIVARAQAASLTATWLADWAQAFADLPKRDAQMQAAFATAADKLGLTVPAELAEAYPTS